MSKAQLRKAMLVIRLEYWKLNCWNGRHLDHSTFTYPSLDCKQREYIAYRYYLYEIVSHPQVASVKNASNKIATSLHPIANRSVRLSDLMALRTGDIEIMVPRQPRKVYQRIKVP